MEDNYKLKSLNDIEILEKNLGLGGFSQVNLIYHKKYKKKFALKIIDLKNFEKLDIFRNEINLQIKIKHKNIIKLYDFLEKNNKVFLLLEYAEKGNLFYYIKDKGNLTVNDSKKFLFQILKTIDFLHQKNIIHRDIKPENILLDSNYNVKLCDFGWSIEIFKFQKRNTFCGTLEYMAPEIFENKKYNNKVDIWSLGILFYEMIHGFSPFKESNFLLIYNKIKDGKIKFKKSIEKITIKYILWMLNINPHKRPDANKLINNCYWKNFVYPKKQNIKKLKFISIAHLLNKNKFKKLNTTNKIINSNCKKEKINNKMDENIRKKYKKNRKKNTENNLKKNNESLNLLKKNNNSNNKTNNKNKMILKLNFHNTLADIINININNENNVIQKNQIKKEKGFFTDRIIKLKNKNN